MKFTKEHEWVRQEGDRAWIGITDYAQRELGEIVFVDLPAVGAELEAGEVLGTVESVKTVSDVYTPFKGRVEKVNTALEEHPELVNEAPYENWMAVLAVGDAADAEALMDAAAYGAYCEKEH